MSGQENPQKKISEMSANEIKFLYDSIMEILELSREKEAFAYENDFHTPIPERFTVHGDYLIAGLSEQFFCEGYREYQKKMQVLQSDMCARTEDFGLIAYDKKGARKQRYRNHKRQL